MKKLVAFVAVWMMVASMLVAFPQDSQAETDPALVLDYTGGASSLQFPSINPGDEMVQSTNMVTLAPASDDGVTYSEVTFNFHNLFHQGEYIPTYDNLVVDWSIMDGNVSVDSGVSSVNETKFTLTDLEFTYPEEIQLSVTVVEIPPDAVGTYSGIVTVNAIGTHMVGGSPSDYEANLDGGQAWLSIAPAPGFMVGYTGGYNSLSFQTDVYTENITSLNYFYIKNVGNVKFGEIELDFGDLVGEDDNETHSMAGTILEVYTLQGQTYTKVNGNFTLDVNGDVVIDENWLPNNAIEFKHGMRLYFKATMPPLSISTPQDFVANITLSLTSEDNSTTVTQTVEDHVTLSVNDTFSPYIVNNIIFEEITPETMVPSSLIEPLRIDNEYSTLNITHVEFYFTDFVNAEDPNETIEFYPNASVIAKRGALSFAQDDFIHNTTVIENISYEAKVTLPLSGDFDAGEYMDFDFNIWNVPYVAPGDYSAYYVAVVYAEGSGFSPAPSLSPIEKTPQVEILYGYVGDVNSDVNVNVAFTDGTEMIHLDNLENGSETNTMLLWNNEPTPITLLNVVYSTLVGENSTADIDLYAIFNGQEYYPDASGSITIYESGQALIEVAQTATIKFIVLNGLEGTEQYEGAVQIMLQDSQSTSYALSPQQLLVGDFFQGFGDWTLEDLLQQPVADMGFEEGGTTPSRTAPEGSVAFDASDSYDPGKEGDPNNGIEMYIWYWGDVVTDVLDVDYPDSFETSTNPVISHNYSYNSQFPTLNTHPVTLFVLDDVGWANLQAYLLDQGYGDFDTAQQLISAISSGASGAPSGEALFLVLQFMQTNGLGAGKQTGLLEIVEAPNPPTIEVSPTSMNVSGTAGEEIPITFYVTPTFNDLTYEEMVLGIDVDVTESETQTIPYSLTIVAPNGNTIVSKEEVDGVTHTLGDLSTEGEAYTVTLFITLPEEGTYHSAYSVYLVGTTYYGVDVVSEEQPMTVDYTVEPESQPFLGLSGQSWTYVLGGLGLVVIVAVLVMAWRRYSTDGQLKKVTKQIEKNVRRGGMRGYQGRTPPSRRGGIERRRLRPPYN